ncbi:host cell division inhibitory peptide Kil [Klebsiella pneumoniae]|uniref:host cell division inhibitory peptide Kil n=3 Tax=Klebsiella/Raoultella group TaxID=2890311 RepID=UPI000E2D6D7D|nr:host cell division inhibitory peptide Kil [Klebsiella pneumoniae]SVO94325.1 Bacteriophage lambda Kil protein [Klebsiella pneumoniae]SWH87583.1 Bacteriophage lambda Kil protein [Klebsiella pneumoniae]SWI21578.1 Bacteriophage lambda Kil protein [Klebsiella pneumoniae]SWS39039.1 Bacteriophage lambda Kil protein [Klebsiella pneumoniae]SWS41625.1 Bacteriophage lambda Kil protein [Klebsiella pneumoniae]
MANLLHGNPAFKAAQSKLAIAQFIGNSEMWAEAFSSMKDIYEEAKHAEDFMFLGRE